MSKITVVKYDHAGVEIFRYPGKVLSRAETRLDIEAIFQAEDNVFHGISFNQGDRFLETYYSDRWYNIMRRELPNGGGLYGWYCNVTTPAEYDGQNIRYVDLDLDVIVDARLVATVVDEDEFLQHSESMAYPPDVIEQSRAAVDELLQLVRSGQPPFDVQ
ncbi:MAG: DUF402 domain-containing protein [Chloroflexi bacterium]|nr:DUF402 domain-containing protein [Chloroflexota bacterium]